MFFKIVNKESEVYKQLYKIKMEASKFHFPFVYITNDDIIILYLDEHAGLPTNENVIEITSKEFEQLRSA